MKRLIDVSNLKQGVPPEFTRHLAWALSKVFDTSIMGVLTVMDGVFPYLEGGEMKVFTPEHGYDRVFAMPYPYMMEESHLQLDADAFCSKVANEVAQAMHDDDEVMDLIGTTRPILVVSRKAVMTAAWMVVAGPAVDMTTGSQLVISVGLTIGVMPRPSWTG